MDISLRGRPSVKTSSTPWQSSAPIVCGFLKKRKPSDSVCRSMALARGSKFAPMTRSHPSGGRILDGHTPVPQLKAFDGMHEHCSECSVERKAESLTAYVNSNRTGVQLKDKWRNLVKFKHLTKAETACLASKTQKTAWKNEYVQSSCCVDYPVLGSFPIAP